MHKRVWIIGGKQLRGKTEVPREKTVTVSVCPLQIPHGHESNQGLRGEKTASCRLSHYTACYKCDLTKLIHKLLTGYLQGSASVYRGILINTVKVIFCNTEQSFLKFFWTQ